MTSRQSSPLLLALGLAAVAAVTWLVFHLSSSETIAPALDIGPPREGITRSVGSGSQDELEADPFEPELAVPVATDDREAVIEPPVLGELDGKEVQWIVGRVMRAPETPADEELFVLSLEGIRSARQLYGDRGIATAAWDPEVKNDDLFHSVPVEEDGSFRVAVPRGASSAHLALTGRYTYSQRTREVLLPLTKELALAGELGSWITGRLLLPRHEGSTGLELEKTPVELGPDVAAGFNVFAIQGIGYNMKTVTAADGRFEFRGIPHQIGHGIVVKHEHLAAHLQAGIHPDVGEHLALEIPLVLGARLSGRVVDEGGVGVAGIDVGVGKLGPIGEGIGDLRSAESGESGEFVLENVYPGKVELRARPEGYRASRLTIEEPLLDGQDLAGLELVIERGNSVTGTVHFPAGVPALGARVSVSPDMSKFQGGMGAAGFDPRDGGSTEVLEDGRFALWGLGDGPFVVSARIDVEDGDNAGAWTADAKGIRGGASGLALVLDGIPTVTGRVVDGNGDPIPNFEIATTLQGSGGIFGIGASQANRSVKDSTDGSFELEGMLRSGTWEFEVRSKGFASSGKVPVVVPQLAHGEPLVFTLAPAAGVSGTVLDTFGNPIRGAQVSIEVGLGERIGQAQSGRVQSALSDAEGLFLLTDLDPGTIPLLAAMDGFAASEPKPVELVSGQVVENVVLQLRVGGLLTGEVLDSEGKPAVGQTVIVQNSPSFQNQHLLSTNAGGEFRKEHLEPGFWQVIAMPNVMTGEIDVTGGEGLGDLLGKMKMGSAEIIDGEETHVVLGKPPEDPVTVSGQVEHSGDPISGSMVSFVPDGMEGMGEMKFVPTDEDGKFEVVLDKRGPYLVTVQNNIATGRQNSVEFREEIPAEGDRYRLTLELPLGRISGRVEGPDGKPAADCRVTLNVDGGMTYGSFLGGHYAEIVTDPEGNYDIPFLRPGTYTVSAGGVALGGMFGGDLGSSPGRVIESGLELADGQWLSGIDFQLHKPGELSGVVQSSAGSPVSGASVFVRDEKGRLLERFSLVTTNAAGRFSYPGLGPGSYTVSAKKGGEVSLSSESVRIDEGGTGEARVVLDEGVTLLVSVTDKTGAEIRARISVTDSEGREVSGMLSLAEIMQAFGQGFSSTAQEVGPLPPGKYRVTAVLDDGRKTRKNVTLSSGQEERKVKLRVK